MDKKSWEDNLTPDHKLYIDKFLRDIINFSQEDDYYKRYFSTCGLYAVGSSLNSNSYGDIDITLAGLDFRSVFDYDNVFLGDKHELIKQKLVVPYNSEDLDLSNQIEFEEGGVKYVNNESLDKWCLEAKRACHIGIGNLPENLFLFLARSRGIDFNPFNIGDNEICPLKPYTSIGEFLGSQYTFGPIHFFIHGENLFTHYWKLHQSNLNLDFVSLHEWDNVEANNGIERPSPFNLSVPRFIDLNGKKRHTLK